MNRHLFVGLVYGGLVLLGMLDLAWHYPRLPERLATHFGPYGEANGWSNKGTFVRLHAVLLVGVPMLMLGLAWWVRILPGSLINVPNRDYWLAPERAEETRSQVSDFVLGFGCCTVGFLLVLMHWILQANLKPEPRLDEWLWIVLGAYGAVTTVLIIRLMAKFRRRPH
jgi:uncharacterized membrane protein